MLGTGFVRAPTTVLIWDPCHQGLPEVLTVAHVGIQGLVKGIGTLGNIRNYLGSVGDYRGLLLVARTLVRPHLGACHNRRYVTGHAVEKGLTRRPPFEESALRGSLPLPTW